MATIRVGAPRRGSRRERENDNNESAIEIGRSRAGLPTSRLADDLAASQSLCHGVARASGLPPGQQKQRA
jgi:hypothetical protein